ncbi:MAG: bifunctional glutamate N-acetyltransferase/amino-acid acetyltransferase ArgJ [Sphingomonadaceae bacterium]
MGGGKAMFDWIDGGTVTSPKGFVAGAVYAGLKTPGPDKKDVGVILSEVPCTVAGVFTTNKVAAAPVVVSRERVRTGRARGIVFNAGNANAATGELGLQRARQMADLAAAKFGVPAEELLVASTGVIGVPLPIEKVQAGIERLVLSAEGGHDAARCIITTDTRPKETAVDVSVDGVRFRLGAIAKGAGMIHPNMATMFCFVTTDAAVDPAFLDAALRRSVDVSFNMISIDGDMSTNDTVLVLANGLAGKPSIAAGTPEAEAFEMALTEVCVRMAKAIAADGEGATRLIEVTVEGAESERDARLAARAVAASNLFKAAVYGGDPNWGRIACAAGYSGANLEEAKLDITIAGFPVLRQGKVLAFDAKAASQAIRQPEVSIVVNLNLGEHRATAWGCDLTEEYVVINSKYTT